jgi:hypothetical protein
MFFRYEETAQSERKKGEQSLIVGTCQANTSRDIQRAPLAAAIIKWFFQWLEIEGYSFKVHFAWRARSPLEWQLPQAADRTNH